MISAFWIGLKILSDGYNVHYSIDLHMIHSMIWTGNGVMSIKHQICKRISAGNPANRAIGIETSGYAAGWGPAQVLQVFCCQVYELGN